MSLKFEESFPLVYRAWDESIYILHNEIRAIFSPRYLFEYIFWFLVNNSKTISKFEKKFPLVCRACQD